MTLFVIDEVLGQGEPWSNSYGAFQPFRLKLSEPDSPIEVEAEWSRKQRQDGTFPQPEVGLRIEADLVEDAFGAKLKNVKVEGAGGQRRPAGAQQSFAPKVFPAQPTVSPGPTEDYWQSRNDQIRRQHSQEMAIRALELAAGTGLINELLAEAGGGYRGLWDLIMREADRFDNDVKRFELDA